LLFFPLISIWLISRLAETNRTPYDFSEGESELVSGFNTEYSAGGFSLLFIAEYGNIIFIGLIFVVLFLSSSVSYSLIIKTMLVRFLFVWVRATLPRYRYDKLIYLAWKTLLPVSLFMLIFYYCAGYLIIVC
jgi:NADH-ubiquinone oxidoreductase chain 1